ncbi:MAG TPA: TetR/AcrR family transcriptional regulator [Candidatus Fimiplasma intestinipullorum]|uniref:TetR/AcrR family transcriptional regulator n=1 Tax=Candidatus Fimiplasma intestinipullorum TaxID=2840825 RepID=A0A9D1HQ39_9FIRM|nr:TetR/AcrR family transcriptional regulator [Candidatus Fimiplasma intestinipullorum]
MGYNKRNDEINTITKESIAFAYYELLQGEKSISVTLICKKAGVSRNAYYRNFNSTDEIIIYCLISKWAKYCEVNPVPAENGEVLKQRLIQFFYSEKEFIRAMKKHDKIYLIEELFRKVIVPAEAVGITKYILYVLAYSVYGMIRAMIDQDFAETPEQIEIMFAEYKSIQNESLRMEKNVKKP